MNLYQVLKRSTGPIYGLQRKPSIVILLRLRRDRFGEPKKPLSSLYERPRRRVLLERTDVMGAKWGKNCACSHRALFVEGIEPVEFMFRLSWVRAFGLRLTFASVHSD